MGIGSSKRTTNTFDNRKGFSDDRDFSGSEGFNGNVGGNVNFDAQGSSGEINVSTTDFGAVRGALDLGETVVDSIAVFSGEALEQNGNLVKQQTFANSQSLQALKDFASEVKTGGQLELSKTMKVVAVSVVVVMGLVVVVVSRGKK